MKRTGHDNTTKLAKVPILLVGLGDSLIVELNSGAGASVIADEGGQ